MRYMLSLSEKVGIFDSDEADDLFEEAVKIVTQYDRASASLLQRRLSIGYARASRIIDQLEAAGVIGPAEGSKPQDVLIQSYDEYVKKAGLPPEVKKKDEIDFAENYKVPTVKLNRGGNIPWGKQLSDVIGNGEFKDFSFPLGFDDQDKLKSVSLLGAGNLIVAGNTLSQKENFIDAILLTYLLKYSPHHLRLILHDPTYYLDLYQGIPHLLSPVFPEYSMLVAAVKWSSAEVDRRLKLFAGAGVRNLEDYNKIDETNALPHILFVSFYNLPDCNTS